MTALLAIDVADNGVGVAVVKDGRVAFSLRDECGSRGSERIFRFIDFALGNAAVDKAELSCLAVTKGPGAFTGLRVGVAAVKGLGMALEIPVVGVSTLEALARSALPNQGLVVPVLDARKKQVYAAAYDGGSGEAAMDEAAWDPACFAESLVKSKKKCLFTGSGLRTYFTLFKDILAENFLAAPPSRWSISPNQVAALGWEAFQRGEAVSVFELSPSYRRLSEAEEALRSR